MIFCVKILIELLYNSCFLFWFKVLHCKIFITQNKKEENYLYFYLDTYNLLFCNEVTIFLGEFHVAFELVSPLNGNQLSVMIYSIVFLIEWNLVWVAKLRIQTRNLSGESCIRKTVWKFEFRCLICTKIYKIENKQNCSGNFKSLE